MSEPITRADLDTQTEVIKRALNDRFDHYEKRQAERHREMMQGVAEAIESVNEHTRVELATLRHDLDIRQEFDHLAASLSQRFGVPIHDLTGR